MTPEERAEYLTENILNFFGRQGNEEARTIINYRLLEALKAQDRDGREGV